MDYTPIVQRKSQSAAFIPKKPVVSKRRSRYYNIFYVISLIVLFAVLAAWGGMFAYNKALLGEKVKLGEELQQKASNVVDLELINDVRQLEQRLINARVLLDGHTITTPLFDFLEDITLSNGVVFNNVDYLYENGVMTVNLSGSAKNFSSLGYQQKLFEEAPEIITSDFSSFSIDEEDGSISFSLNFLLDSSLISYQRSITSDGGIVLEAGDENVSN
tara:strand:- start:2976 stop:3626 length:651 start_codon:yes stop_codon:yes gene_type:complete